MLTLIVSVRPWTADELRKKSFADLHVIWYLCLRERNIYATQRTEMDRLKIQRDFTYLALPLMAYLLGLFAKSTSGCRRDYAPMKSVYEIEQGFARFHFMQATSSKSRIATMLSPFYRSWVPLNGQCNTPSNQC